MMQQPMPGHGQNMNMNTNTNMNMNNSNPMQLQQAMMGGTPNQGMQNSQMMMNNNNSSIINNNAMYQQPQMMNQQQQQQQQQPQMMQQNRGAPQPQSMQARQPQPQQQQQQPRGNQLRSMMSRPPYVDPNTNIIYETDNAEYEGFLTKQSMWLRVSTNSNSNCIPIAFPLTLQPVFSRFDFYCFSSDSFSLVRTGAAASFCSRVPNSFIVPTSTRPPTE